MCYFLIVILLIIWKNFSEEKGEKNFNEIGIQKKETLVEKFENRSLLRDVI